MPRRPAQPAAARKESFDRRTHGLACERDRLMREIALRASLDALPPMLVKARTLLTRFWGRSTWDTRSELLTAARMLITLGAAQPALQAQEGGPNARRRPRTVRGPRRERAAKASAKASGKSAEVR